MNKTWDTLILQKIGASDCKPIERMLITTKMSYQKQINPEKFNAF